MRSLAVAGVEMGAPPRCRVLRRLPRRATYVCHRAAAATLPCSADAFRRLSVIISATAIIMSSRYCPRGNIVAMLAPARPITGGYVAMPVIRHVAAAACRHYFSFFFIIYNILLTHASRLLYVIAICLSRHGVALPLYVRASSRCHVRYLFTIPHSDRYEVTAQAAYAGVGVPRCTHASTSYHDAAPAALRRFDTHILISRFVACRAPKDIISYDAPLLLPRARAPPPLCDAAPLMPRGRAHARLCAKTHG